MAIIDGDIVLVGGGVAFRDQEQARHSRSPTKPFRSMYVTRDRSPETKNFIPPFQEGRGILILINA